MAVTISNSLAMARDRERPVSRTAGNGAKVLAFVSVAAAMWDLATSVDAAFPVTPSVNLQAGPTTSPLPGTVGPQLRYQSSAFPTFQPSETPYTSSVGATANSKPLQGIASPFEGSAYPIASANAGRSPVATSQPSLSVQQRPLPVHQGPVILSTLGDGRAGVVSSIFDVTSLTPQPQQRVKSLTPQPQQIQQVPEPLKEAQAIPQKPTSGMHLPHLSSGTIHGRKPAFLGPSHAADEARRPARHPQQFSAWGDAQSNNVLVITLADATLFQGRTFWLAGLDIPRIVL